MKRALSFLILALAAMPVHAQGGRLDAAVHAYLAPFAEVGDFSGVALVMRGDTVLAQVAAGEASPGRPNTPGTLFRIASVTKPFTAAAVLRLVREGRVGLDTGVCEYVRPCPGAWGPVTVRHLLSHTSGIPDYTALPDDRAQKAQAKTSAELVARFSGLPLEFAPGERYAYSNSGYAVLGRVIESVTGQAYPDALRALVLSPLGLGGVHYGDVAGGALGYRYGPAGLGREPAEAIDLSGAYAAGGLVASAAEVAGFARGFFRGGLLADTLLAEALTPVQGRYGLGWRTGSHGPDPAAWHAGSIDGFASYLVYRPDADVSVVVLSNQEGAPVQRMARDIVRMADGEPVAPPVARHAVALPEADLDAVVGTYRVDPTFEFVVRRSGGGLEVEATGQPPIPIVAERRDGFFTRAVDAQFTFERDASGNVVRLVLHQGGQAIPADRL